MQPPIANTPHDYPELTEDQIKAKVKYEEPVSDAYMEITFTNGKAPTKVYAYNLCTAPDISESALVITWHTENTYRKHAQQIIPMSQIADIITFPASDGYLAALDRYTIQESGMTYEESTKATRAAVTGASLDNFLRAVGADPDDFDLDGFSG